MKEYKQCIRIGRNITDIFNLPCVIEIKKLVNGKPLYTIAASDDNGKYMQDLAETGDWLCQDNNEKWHVLTDKVYSNIQ